MIDVKIDYEVCEDSRLASGVSPEDIFLRNSKNRGGQLGQLRYVLAVVNNCPSGALGGIEG